MLYCLYSDVPVTTYFVHPDRNTKSIFTPPLLCDLVLFMPQTLESS